MRIKTKMLLVLLAAVGLPVCTALCVAVAIKHAQRFTDDLIRSENIATLSQDLGGLCHHQHNQLPLEHIDEWERTLQSLAILFDSDDMSEDRVSTLDARKALGKITTHLAFMKLRGDGPLSPEADTELRPHYTNIVIAVDALENASASMKNELYTDYRRMNRTIGFSALTLIGLLALTTGAGVVWGGRRLVRRVDRITEGMRAVAGGDLAYTIDLKTTDELGDVAREFDQMTARLSGTLEQKEQLNRELKVHQLAEEEIHRTQDLTRQWLNTCTDGVWDWYLDDDYEYMSPRFWELFGYDPDSKQHHPSAWQEILHKDDVDKLARGLEEHTQSKGETPIREELRFHHHDGHIIWVLSRGQVIEWHEDGSAKRLVGTHTDITRMKEAERRVRETHELLSAVMDQSPDAIFVKALDGTYTLMNAAGAERYGTTVEDVIGATCTDIFTPEDADTMTRIDKDVLASGKPYTFEQVLTIEGSSTTMLTSKAPFRNSRGKIVGLIGMSRDISELSATRQALQKQTKELEKSNRELEQFAYVASHDLQEPLRKISAFGDLLEQTDGDKLSEEGREFLAFMHNASSRMQVLVRDLLELSRVAMHGHPFEAVDLSELCMDVVTDLEFAIEDSGGSVEIEKLPTIMGDPTQMRQLLQNLVGNAIKFRQPDIPIKVIVGPDPEAANANNASRCCLRVKDNGIGFDEKHSERIFGVFQRLHSKQAFPGSGMGLAICRKIAERHGGALTVSSAPNEGTVFHIDLPMHQKGKTGSDA